MKKFYENLLSTFDVNASYIESYAIVLVTITALLIACMTFFLARYIEKKYLDKFVNKSKTKWDDYMVKRGFFKLINILAPLVIIESMLTGYKFYDYFFTKIIQICIVIIFVLIANAFFLVCNDIYSNYRIAKARPIKSYLQVASLTVTIIGILVSMGLLLNKSPLAILSGIGAMTAVIMLIFKDSILGFVASIQLAANSMVAIGDWIEMPSQSADGDVIEINLTNVKVQNFDKTITTIPSYALVSNSFRNWKGMTQSGGRRIKRSLNIDASSIRFLTDQEIEKLKKINILKDYLSLKMTELERFNNSIDLNSSIANGRKLTNIGTFRAYIERYLIENPNIAKDKTMLVRQLAPSTEGIPLEIYCFANNTQWSSYEGIQADIFDHLLAIIHEFDLDLFQNPTGRDFNKILK